MLSLIRRYQKGLFIVIAFFVIGSMLFFGTFSTFDLTTQIEEKVVGNALSGKSVKQTEVQKMSCFLTSNGTDFFSKEFLSTGLGTILAEKEFSSMKEEIGERVKRMQRYRPYVHPQLSLIRAESIWQSFVPEIPVILKQIKEQEVGPSFFPLLIDLYLAEEKCPPEMLYRILSYQQNMYEGVIQDRSLSSERVAFFPSRTLEEWFGPQFVKKTALFFINAAHLAEKRGYKISQEEAKVDLLEAVAAKMKTGKAQEFTSKEAKAFLTKELRALQIREEEAIQIWKKIMLFRRLFEDVGHSVFLDPLLYKQFAQFAGESVTLEMYQLPPQFRFADFRAFLKFQHYLDGLDPKNRSHLAKLPVQNLSIAEVEKRAPQLVQSKCILEVVKLSQEELRAKVSLKESWAWACEDGGWEMLLSHFPMLDKAGTDKKEARFKALEEQEPSLRRQIDRFMQEQIVTLHPEWKKEILQQKAKEKQNARILSKGASPPFEEIEETQELLKLLYSAKEGETFSFTTPDREVEYLITVIEKPTKKEIMTFEESLEGDWIGTLLDKKLQGVYPEVRKKEPSIFQDKQGNWKSFESVKDQVGSLVYADLLKEISFNHRMKPFLEEGKKNILQKQDNSPYLVQTQDRIRDQFCLIKTVKEVKRESAGPLPKEEIFSLAEGAWSTIFCSGNGNLSFCRLLKKENNPESVTELCSKGQEILSRDAKRLLMIQLLEEMDKK